MNRQWLGTAFFFALLLLILYFAFLILTPFLKAIAWAVILAILVYPVYAWLLKLLRWRATPAALIVIVAITLLVIVTCVFFGPLPGAAYALAGALANALATYGAGRVLGRLQLTSVRSPQLMQSLGDNAFAPTPQSGPAGPAPQQIRIEHRESLAEPERGHGRLYAIIDAAILRRPRVVRVLDPALELIREALVLARALGERTRESPRDRVAIDAQGASSALLLVPVDGGGGFALAEVGLLPLDGPTDLTRPSAVWWFSSSGTRILGEARAVLLSVWAKRTLPSLPR